MAAPTAYYVDPAINANSGTGTALDPFGDLQYCLNTITRDATNGNIVHIKAGTAEVLAASLTLATYGTPAAGAPLILAGYTSAAGDGGVAEIDAGGYRFFAATNYTNFGLVSLLMHNFGNNNGIQAAAAAGSFLDRCKVHAGASSPSSKTLVNVEKVTNCWIYNAGSGGIGLQISHLSYGNYLYNCPYGIFSAGHGSVCEKNILVDCGESGTGAIYINARGSIKANSIYSSTANTGAGILADTAVIGAIINNVIEGYSGTGGTGIKVTGTNVQVYGNNSIYNCSTPSSLTNNYSSIGADTTLSASPFTNAAGGDFSLKTTVTGVIENAYPTTWYGPASTTNKADRGAVQKGAGTGGAVTISPSRGGGL